MTIIKSNRNKIRQWFITYPQWSPNKKEELLNLFLLSAEYKLIYYKIAQESHEDGNPHYHLILKLEEGLSKNKLLTLLKDAYPENYKRIDVKSIRSLKASVQYLDKEDKSCLEHPDGYVETRLPLSHVYKKALKDWSQFMGFDTTEDYEIYLKNKLIIKQEKEISQEYPNEEIIIINSTNSPKILKSKDDRLQFLINRLNQTKLLDF